MLLDEDGIDDNELLSTINKEAGILSTIVFYSELAEVNELAKVDEIAKVDKTVYYEVDETAINVYSNVISYNTYTNYANYKDIVDEATEIEIKKLEVTEIKIVITLFKLIISIVPT